MPGPQSQDPEFRTVGICHTCAHRTGPFTCVAFPDGIPVEILVGDFDHNQPYPGDRGIRYRRITREQEQRYG